MKTLVWFIATVALCWACVKLDTYWPAVLWTIYWGVERLLGRYALTATPIFHQAIGLIRWQQFDGTLTVAEVNAMADIYREATCEDGCFRQANHIGPVLMFLVAAGIAERQPTSDRATFEFRLSARGTAALANFKGMPDRC